MRKFLRRLQPVALALPILGSAKHLEQKLGRWATLGVQSVGYHVHIHDPLTMLLDGDVSHSLLGKNCQYFRQNPDDCTHCCGYFKVQKGLQQPVVQNKPV